MRPPDPGATFTSEIISDLLWVHVTPDDQIEHIRVRRLEESFDVTWFARAPADRVQAVAERICQQAIASAPALIGWCLI